MQKRKNKDYVPSTQKIRHVDAVLKMLAACSGDNRFYETFIDKKQGESERKVTTMCEVLDKIVARGEARGRAIGEAHGKAIGEARMVFSIRRKLEKHMNVSEIADLLELEEDYVADIAFLLMQSPQKTDIEIAGEYLNMKKSDVEIVEKYPDMENNS